MHKGDVGAVETVLHQPEARAVPDVIELVDLAEARERRFLEVRDGGDGILQRDPGVTVALGCVIGRDPHLVGEPAFSDLGDVHHEALVVELPSRGRRIRPDRLHTDPWRAWRCGWQHRSAIAATAPDSVVQRTMS